MLEKLIETFRKVGVYSLGNFITAILSFILIPLYSKTLTIDEFGNLSIFEITAGLLTILLSFGIPSFLLRWYPEAATKKERKQIISISAVTCFAICFIFIIFTFSFTDYFSVILFSKKDFSTCVLILIFYVFFDTINKIPLQILRVQEAAFKYIFYSALKLFISLVVCIVLVAYYNMGITGVLIGLLAGSVFFSFLTLGVLLPWLTLKIDFKVAKDMFLFSYPLAFSAVFTMLLYMADRYFLLFYKGSSDVGIYSLAYKFSSALTLFIITPFQVGFMPIAYKVYKEENAKFFFAKVHSYLFYGLISISLLFSLFARQILILFTVNNNTYWIAYKYVPVLCLIVVVTGIQYIYIISLRIVKKSGFDFIAVILSFIVNIILNFTLVPRFGINGAVISSLSSFAVMTLVYYIYAQKFYRIEYEFGKCIKVLFIAVFIYIISTFNFSFFFFQYPAKFILLFLYFYLLWKFILDNQEKRNLRQITTGVFYNFKKK